MANGLRLRVFGQQIDTAGHGDLLIQQTRSGITVGPINDIELPGRGAIIQLDSVFWSSWVGRNANADFVRRGLVHQVG
jgi:hypothetical protein